jgi:hypothetical protein
MYSKRKPPRPKQHGASVNKANARSGRIKADSLSDRAFEAKNRAFHTIARMRHDGLSLGAASREESTTPATVKKYLRGALRRSRKTGKWTATKDDRYVRPLTLPGPHGPVAVSARGYSEAQLASIYLASLARWARQEKAYELSSFHGKSVGGQELLTSDRALRALRDAGLLQLDSLYAALKDTV